MDWSPPVQSSTSATWSKGAANKQIPYWSRRDEDFCQQDDQYDSLQDELADFNEDFVSRTPRSRFRRLRRGAVILEESDDDGSPVIENDPSPDQHMQLDGHSVNVKKHVLPLKGDPMAGTVRTVKVQLSADDSQHFLVGALSSFGVHPAVPTAADSAEQLQRVIACFEDSGLSAKCLVRVERVENGPLFVSYNGRKTNGPASEERFLWCALSTADVAKVELKGFSALHPRKSDMTAAGPLFMANAAVALGKAIDAEKSARGMSAASAAAATATLTSPEAPAAQLVPVELVAPKPQPSTVVDAGQAVSAAVPGPSRAQGLGGRLLRALLMLQRLFISGRRGQEEQSLTDPATTVQALLPPAPSPISTRELQGTALASGVGFPGTGGALLLCRVVLGRVALGGEGADFDSFMDLKTIVESQSRSRSPTEERMSQCSPPGPALDPAWNVSGLYAETLAVFLRNAAVQAYPEYVVHFNDVDISA